MIPGWTKDESMARERVYKGAGEADVDLMLQAQRRVACREGMWKAINLLNKCAGDAYTQRSDSEAKNLRNAADVLNKAVEKMEEAA